MEKRRYPRIQLPLLVELAHPTLGRERCLARDISEGGVFLNLADSGLPVGAKVKLTLLNVNSEEHQATPTVDASIVRTEDQGIALEFTTVISRHLWQSVERVRDELAVGRDYFQVHQSAVVVNDRRQLLVVQSGGRWRFPGTYLVVGEDWNDALRACVAAETGITELVFERTLSVDSTPEVALPEAAVMQLAHLYQSGAERGTLPDGGSYADLRWLARPQQAEELTFHSSRQRELAATVLSELRDAP